MSTTPEVLIIGAGPTGLTLSIELLRRNITIRLIDRLPSPRPTSRAFTVHARTLELFDRVGLADSFVAGANPVNGFVFNFQGKHTRPALDFSRLHTKFPYVAVCDQRYTEATLAQFLNDEFGFSPEWGTKLVSLAQELHEDGPAITAVLKRDASDAEETIHPMYVVGCDGTNGTVRKEVGIENDDSKYDGMLMQMMDVNVENFPGTDDWIHYHMSKHSFLLLSKLPSGAHRIVISKMRADIDPNLAPQQLFQQLLDEQISDTKLDQPIWETKWQIWKRLADRFSEGNVFLAGDAAHVHSPSGGQGMNVGMQDAFNLGWKLAAVIKGYAKQELLESYEKERKPIAAQAIAGTDAMHNVIMAHGKGMQDRLKLTQEPGWHEAAVERISGLSYHYRDVSDVPDTGFGNCQLQAGDRAPCPQTCDEGLTALMTYAYLSILVITEDCSSAEVLNVKHVIETEFPNCAKVHLFEKGDEQFVKAYDSLEGDHVFVLRPDGYILMRCEVKDVDVMVGYMKRTFHDRESSAFT